MVYGYTVKRNGVLYKAGTEVPDTVSKNTAPEKPKNDETPQRVRKPKIEE